VPFVVCLALVVTAWWAARAQPAFRSGVQGVEVDVLVTGRDGTAVRDLGVDDFVLLEDGIPQRIAGVSAVNAPILSRTARSDFVQPDVVTNTAHTRMYTILLGTNPRTRRLAHQFVDEAAEPGDAIAVVHVLRSAAPLLMFTRSHRLISDAIDDPGTPRNSAGPAGGAYGNDAVTAAFRVAENVFSQLGAISGRRKAVIWLSPPPLFRLKVPGQAVAQRDALRAATRNNVAIYAVAPEGLTALLGRGTMELMAGVRLLSEETGGQSIVNSNNFAGGFQRLVRDNSSYYLLTYSPAVEHRDGKFHNIEVRVKRDGVTARSRDGYYAAEPIAASNPSVTGLARDGSAQAVRLPLFSPGLGIELFATPFKGNGSQGSVLIGAQLRGNDLALDDGQQLEIAFEVLTTDGVQARGASRVFALNFPRESREAIQRTGLRVLDRVELPAARYQLRFTARQPNGTTGSVFADVDVPDYSSPLTMSGVALASQNTAAYRTLLSDPRPSALLSSPPTAIRQFSTPDVLTAFVEVYTNPPRPELVQVTARLASMSGKRVDKLAVTISSREADRTGYIAHVRLADLAPGDYAITLEAAQGARKISRQLPFSVLSN
jgi:VWFA-related protein